MLLQGRSALLDSYIVVAAHMAHNTLELADACTLNFLTSQHSCALPAFRPLAEAAAAAAVLRSEHQETGMVILATAPHYALNCPAMQQCWCQPVGADWLCCGSAPLLCSSTGWQGTGCAAGHWYASCKTASAQPLTLAGCLTRRGRWPRQT